MAVTMLTDMLEQMNRRQLELTARKLRLTPSRYPTKVKLVAAIRRKRGSL